MSNGEREHGPKVGVYSVYYLLLKTSLLQSQDDLLHENKML